MRGCSVGCVIWEPYLYKNMRLWGGILHYNTRTCEDLNERICNYSGAQINLQSPL